MPGTIAPRLGRNRNEVWRKASSMALVSSSSDTSARRFLLPLIPLWTVYISHTIRLYSNCRCFRPAKVNAVHIHIIIIIVWLVRCWTLPFLRACSRLDDFVPDDWWQANGECCGTGYNILATAYYYFWFFFNQESFLQLHQLSLGHPKHNFWNLWSMFLQPSEWQSCCPTKQHQSIEAWSSTSQQ